jgi:integrase
MESGELTSRLGEYTINQGIELYIQDARGRNLAPETLRSLMIILNNLVKAFDGKRFSEIQPADLLTFRGGWTLSSTTVLKRWERIRAFFRWAQKNKLCRDNPADGLRSPKSELSPTLPYSQNDLDKILKAVKNNSLLHALILTLLHSGLRISDAVQLGPTSLVGDSLRIRTQKTGADVRVPLPLEVLSALQSLPVDDGKWFWNGRIKLTKRIGNLRRTFQRSCKTTEGEEKTTIVPDLGFHRFRDTAAVRWLEAGLSVQDVASLLGNSVRIVEKHYSAWIEERSVRLEARVRSLWAQPEPHPVRHVSRNPKRSTTATTKDKDAGL